MAIINTAGSLISRTARTIGRALGLSGLRTASSAGRAVTKTVVSKAPLGTAQKAARETVKAASKSKLAPLARDTVTIPSRTEAKKEAVKLIQKELKSIIKGLGIKRATIKRLSGLEPTAFALESFREIGRAMHIPQELMPQLAFGDIPGKRLQAVYTLASHGILISNAALKKSKAALFSIIAHEMQHAKQGLLIFRSKTAPRAIKTSAKSAGKGLTNAQINAIRSMTPQQIEQMAKDNPLLALYRILQSNNAAEIKGLEKNLKTAFTERQKKALLDFRKRVLEVMGPTSSEAEELVAKGYFNGMIESNSDRLKGNILRYSSSLPETEAFMRTYKEFWSFLLKNLI